MDFLLSLKNNKIFRGIFKKVTVITFIAVVVLSASLYIYAANTVLSLYYNMNLSIFSHIVNNTSFLHSQLESNIVSISSSINAYTQMNTRLNILDVQKTMKGLNELKQLNPLIYSIYIYNSDLDTFYIYDGNLNTYYVRQNNFYDDEIRVLIKNHILSGSLVPIARTMSDGEAADAKRLNVLTYILTESYHNDGNVPSSVVINVLSEDFYRRTISNQDSSLRTYFIVDSKGLIVAHERNDLFLTVFSGKEFMNRILSNEKESGYTIDYYNGEKVLINYKKIPSRDWILISMEKFSNINQIIKTFRAGIIFMSFAIIFIAVFLSYHSSKQIYTPFEQIFSKLSKIKMVQDNQSFNTVAAVESHISNIKNEFEQLESFKEENKHYVKSDNIRKFLLGNPSQRYSPYNTVSRQDFENLSYVLFMFKFDNYKEFCGKIYSDRFLYGYALINIAQELTEKYYKCDYTDMLSDHIVAVVVSDGSDMNYKNFNYIARQTQEFFSKYFSVSISCFMSDKTNDFHELSSIYNDLLEFSNYRIVCGHECILTKDLFEYDNLIYKPIEYNLVTELCDNLKLNNLTANIKLLDVIFSQIKRRDYTNMMLSISTLASALFASIAIIEKLGKLSFETDYATFSKNLNICETLDEIKNSFTVLLTDIYKTMQKRKDNRYDELVNNIKNYVESNFADSSISTKSIASEFNLSAKYIAKIFYNATNQTLQLYITNKRIEKAMELLSTTSLSIKKIMERIGWTNIKYLYTVFKKTTGLTPSEYRKSNKKSPKIM